MIQVGGFHPAHGRGLRDAKAVRAAPDHRRHARHRRHHARPAHDPRGARHVRGTWKSSAPTCCSSTTPTRWRWSLGAVQRATKISTVGLCHSVQGTAMQLAHALGVPYEEIDYLCAGINHMAFYLKLRATARMPTRCCGRDTASRGSTRRRRRPRADGGERMHDAVRYEMFRRLGYFVTESTEHFAEYVPWFIKPRPPRTARAVQHPARRVHPPLRDQRRRLARDAGGNDEAASRSAVTADARVLRRDHPRARDAQPAVIYGNVPNTGLIDNLPAARASRCPASSIRKASSRRTSARLPAQLAALMQTNINVQELTVEAALDQQARARLSRRDARPAHRRRTHPGRNLGARGRAV